MARPPRPPLPLLLLVLSAILFRGLIPAGYMPVSATAARHGALLMACAHGAMQAPAPDPAGKHPAHQGVEQCPFGAAVTPALAVGGPLRLLVLAGVTSLVRQAWAATLRRGPPAHRQPPARGPPGVS